MRDSTFARIGDNAIGFWYGLVLGAKGRMGRYALLIICLGLVGSVSAQGPGVTLDTDKDAYDLFEPIIASVAVTNTGSFPAKWGAPSGPRPAVESVFGFRLGKPSGRWSPDIGLPIIPHTSGNYTGHASTTYAPGQTHSYSYNLLWEWPIWKEAGTYTLQFGRTRATKPFFAVLATATFVVGMPPGVDVALVDEFRDLTDDVMQEGAWHFTGDVALTEQSLLTFADDVNVTASMRELARFQWALLADIDGRTQTEIDSRYSTFMQEYPASVYTTAAQQQFPLSALLRGAPDPYYTHADTEKCLRLRVFFEGAYINGGTLKTTLSDDDVVPNTQPFDRKPWDNGWDNTVGQPSVDWILVRLTDNLGTNVVTYTARVGPTGDALVYFTNVPSGDYHIIVEHRNHLPVVSDDLVDFSQGYIEYDFTTGSHEGAEGQNEVETGVYAMWAGDGCVDGVINEADEAVWASERDSTGYLSGDYNLDARVGVDDRELLRSSGSAAAPEWVREILYGGAGCSTE